MEAQPPMDEREEGDADMALGPLGRQPNVSATPSPQDQQVAHLSPQEIISLPTSAKLARAGQAVQEMGLATAQSMDAGLLADEIDRRSGVGFEIAIMVALEVGH